MTGISSERPTNSGTGPVTTYWCFHVGEGRLVTQPGADAVRIAAGGVDHVLAGDVALLGRDPELAARKLLDRRDALVPYDRGAEALGGGRHGVAGAGWVDVAVIEGPGAGARSPDFDPLRRGHARMRALVGS